ncbi:MAG: TIGR04290 family methyltransferase [Allosphingosinicella sp.]|uniref:TIGR04290 family methyltransferase n=1 Tax=Allosphingosinicella sp. TaxID=2823234 RepID=UPI00394E675F
MKPGRDLAPDERVDLEARIAALAPWFHNMNLGGVWTAPDHFLGDYPNFKFARFEAHLPADLSGKSVLDIGCNAGFYAIEMKKRGAARVLGIDSDPRYLAQGRLAADALGFTDIEFRDLSVYDVGALGERFDVVIFMGVLYHLRHPLLALDLIREHVADDILVFQTLQRGTGAPFEPPTDHPFYLPGTLDPPTYFDEPGYPKLHFVEREYAHDWTNWWIPNRACAEAMLRSAGFSIETAVADEDGVYICRVADVPYGNLGPVAVYPAKGRI